MSTPAERLVTLMEAHDDSLRSAAERCGLDHTTLIRVKGGETENPATLAKIAEGYRVPVTWVHGERDLATDFAFAVLARPLSERIRFLLEPRRRDGYALAFLKRYNPQEYTVSRLAELVHQPVAEIEGILKGKKRPLPMTLERLCTEIGLPSEWFRTGLVGRENEHEIMVGLSEWTLSTLAESLGLDVSQEEIQEAALALAG